ncbi:MAG: hypothetical protein ABSB42_19085 [Tepidisphaeraceae bacterium]|jgi:hypothetical protein
MSTDPSPTNLQTKSYADFVAPIACKMPMPAPPRGGMGHSGDDWDFSQFDELTERQLRAIELTMLGHTDVQIAQRLQINRKTLWRWKTLDQCYRRVLAQARIQLYAAATDRYQMLLGRATSILAKFLDDPADDRRFPAALAVLNMAGAFKPLPLSYFPISDPPPPALPEPPPKWPEPDLEPKVG